MSFEANESLRHLNECLDPSISKHDRAMLLIAEAISLGIDQGTLIIQALRRLGLNSQHVGKLLHDHNGPFPARHHWDKLDGKYVLHPTTNLN